MLISRHEMEACISAMKAATSEAEWRTAAHTLKGEARQFGADPLATLAEKIENFARQCVEHHESPRDAIADVVALRPLFLRTLTELERHASPLAVRRRAGFGNRQG